MPEEKTLLAGCTVRGWFAGSQAKKHGEMIRNDLAERGIEVVPVTQRTGFMACMLLLQITCDESVEQQVRQALDPLGFDFIEQ